jgi:hypothetical protein
MTQLITARSESFGRDVRSETVRLDEYLDEAVRLYFNFAANAPIESITSG